eukprot:CAMPEP_0198567710 /NCGR_PEP_ID=MMETSP1462-20131121/105234_1 /TAXON_ID=1333877 /ORGANISM="Brandtodinium nutriculum, Strain RCC3387" /LENGTH=105 /DNA_ID=CAMNT_0044298761 /DNA_START=14 /DNA_END=328 /DNA_ORIENTATION=+
MANAMWPLPIGDAQEEELEEVPQAEKGQDTLMYACVRKDGFVGHVEEIERGSITRELLYRVCYRDGDIEHFTADDVQRYRILPPPDAERDRLIPALRAPDGDLAL